MTQPARTGTTAAVIIAVIAMAYAILHSSAAGALQFWEPLIPIGIIGGIILAGMLVGRAVERSRIESPVARAVIVGLSALAAGYVVFALVGFLIFAIVTSD